MTDHFTVNLCDQGNSESVVGSQRVNYELLCLIADRMIPNAALVISDIVLTSDSVSSRIIIFKHMFHTFYELTHRFRSSAVQHAQRFRLSHSKLNSCKEAFSLVSRRRHKVQNRMVTYSH